MTEQTKQEVLLSALMKFNSQYQEHMKWSESATDHERSLVFGNLNGFCSFLSNTVFDPEMVARDRAEETVFIGFGEGRVQVSEYSRSDGIRGLILRDSGEPHAIGEEIGDEDVKNYVPQPGEVYLQFKNPESAMVLREMLDQVIKAFLGENLGTVA